MKIIKNNKTSEALYAQYGVVLEISASKLTQGGYGGLFKKETLLFDYGICKVPSLNLYKKKVLREGDYLPLLSTKQNICK